ncbi:MAG: hypothetical protein GXY06_03275 [Clostridiaceae bacterium]|nr:hypothetical protein [Clostridiaceae bacterium]
MEKVLQRIFIVFFFLLCALPIIGLLLGYRNDNAEKRVLAKWPSFFVEGKINQKYPSEIEEYLADHFAFRPLMVTADAKLKASVFRESTSEMVIIGKEGWLFFQPTLDDYQHVNKLSDNDLYRINRILEIQEEYLSRQGVRMVFMVAPNKSSIYPEYMPDRFVCLDSKSDYERLREKLEYSQINVINLHEALSGRNVQVYHKFDTHWNNLGATICYGLMVEEMKKVNPSLNLVNYESEPYVFEKNFDGDLSKMLYPSMGILDDQAVFDIAGEFRTVRPMRSPEDLLIQTNNESGQPIEVLMFRDSFANALIPFLSGSINAITYSRAVPYDYALLTEETDIVFVEIAERNLSVLLQGPTNMPSYRVERVFDICDATLETKAMWMPTQEGVFIYGVAIPESGDRESNYEIYLRLHSDNEEFTFVTIPVLEGPYVQEESLNANAAFSARIDFATLPSGIYSASVVVCGPQDYEGVLQDIQFEVP